MRIVVAITGASGVILGKRFLETVAGREDVETHLIVSKWAVKLLETEADTSLDQLEKIASFSYDNSNLSAPLASGSFPFDSMVVIPCSVHTLSMIANGLADDLISRSAAVALKERRKLVLVVRETPLNEIVLENMLKVARAGAVVLPPVLAFYHGPKTVKDLVDYVVGKVLDIIGIKHDLFRRWTGL